MKTKELIVDEFIQSFGSNGYEGTSVDFIAKQVGIKKGSLYTHYAGKNKIFTIACEKILDKTIAVIGAALAVQKDAPPDERLYTILKMICLEGEYLTANEIAFLKRVALMSSEELLSLVGELLSKYDSFINDVVNRLFAECADKNIISKSEIEAATEAFHLLLDNLFMNVFGNKSREKTLRALWCYFWKGVRA